MLAIVKVIRKWRPYLLGRPFIVPIDQRSLKYLLEQCITTPAQARWLPKLLGYGYKIEYKPSRENQGADALSRVGELCLSIVSLPVAEWWKKLQDEVSRDPFYTAQANKDSNGQDFRFQDGIFYFKGKIYLNPSCSLIPAMLKEFHSTATGGHFGYLKTVARIKQNFHWPGLHKMVKRFRKECSVCQRNKYETMKPAGLLQPLPIPESIWSEVSMDFIEGLPISKRYNVIMVVVDQLSKYSHFIPL